MAFRGAWWGRRRRVTYPLGGALLSLAIPALLLMVRALGGRSGASSPGAWQAIRSELMAQPFTYAYLVGATVLTLTFLGWLAGRQHDALLHTSGIDPLTGLANRRRLDAAFAEELNRAARYGTPLALLLVDVDLLKQVNDTLGHRAGDRALQLVGEALRRSCRTTDLPARWGGDEFAVLAGNTTANEALALAQRIRTVLRRLCTGGPAVSVSIGAADLDRVEEPTLEAVMLSADQALYRAKATGRDRAVSAAAVSRSARIKLMAAAFRSTGTRPVSGP